MESDGRGGRGEREKKKRLQNAPKMTHSESSLWAGQQVGPQSEEMGRKGLGLGRTEINRKSDNAKHTFHRFTKTLNSFRKVPRVQKRFYYFSMANVMVSRVFQEAGSLSPSDTGHNAAWHFLED